MNRTRTWFDPRYLILPGIYVIAVILTIAISPGTAGGAYYRIIGVCPPAGSIGMAFDNAAALVGGFLVIGTPWWYFVGRVGWDSYERKSGFARPIVGAVIALFTCFISTVMTAAVFRRDGEIMGAARVQYWLVGVLCLGALVSTLFALGAVVAPPET